MSITLSTGIFELMAGAKALGAPEKLLAMLALMTRYVKVVGSEYERLIWAIKIRGFSPSLTLHTLKTYANLAGILLVRGIDRAERVHAAMLCRGYRGRLYFDTTLEMTKVDLYLSLLFLIWGSIVILTNVL
jgi:cobalt/nickel transport system permease protein